MAHSQKSLRDHARNRSQPNIDNKVISQQLEELVKPCVYNQLAYYRSLGMRERILSLPLMLAAVLTLVWRQVPSARELNRMLARENLLWVKATKVSQQALSQRLLTFPAVMLERVLRELLILLNQRWHQRKQRPLPLSVAHANQHFEQLWIVDTSTLEALFRKLKSLETDLYSWRWRIEETFLLLKRLLGLSYLWTGSINGIKLQLWSNWLFYVILVDLSDGLAEYLSLPLENISVEMVFRGIYHFTQALNQGVATNLIEYLTAPENLDLGIVKSLRPKRAKSPLDLSPFPS